MRKVIRSAQGGQQACVLATNGCYLPYHLSLCRTQRQFRAAEILCQADDTYMRHPRRVDGDGAEQTAADAFEANELCSNLPKDLLDECGSLLFYTMLQKSWTVEQNDPAAPLGRQRVGDLNIGPAGVARRLRRSL